VCEQLRQDKRPVHIICAGTDGQVTLEDTLLENEDMPNFVVLTAGSTPPNPSELLNSRTFRNALWLRDCRLTPRCHYKVVCLLPTAIACC
jgi:hypothetical protein